ncbi:MAG: acyl transferase [Bacteroidetes bacterium]|nr:acyl transferase [Bacteroidota bacterium]
MKPLIDSVFKINSELGFRDLALSVFKYQSVANEVYRKYIEVLGQNPDNVSEIGQIPFLPIDFFKSYKVQCKSDEKAQNGILFTSSGTTGSIQSKHFVSDVSVYEKSYLKGFELFYGSIEEYCVLALLPSYLERDGSSLIYMAEDLIKRSKNTDSGFYLNNYDELILKLNALMNSGQKTILIGVTYALLDLAEKFPLFNERKGDLKNIIVMETGGMKGKRKEMVREELHTILCKGIGVNSIHSEYGMTELLSQAYSSGNGLFNCPPWMKILIRDTNDPFSFLPPNKTGGINVIDLANINSCSFIATQDLGKVHPDNSFEILGRFDNSDIRGCNLLVQ